MPSERFDPIWWTSRSENRFAVWLPRPPNVDGPVGSDLVWQKVQPVLLNSALPLLTEVEQFTPTVQAGAGGARKRMKWENITTSQEIFSGWVKLIFVLSSGATLNWQPGVWSRSV